MRKYRCPNCGAPYCTDCDWGAKHYPEPKKESEES